ncbi:hypothetical protein Z043_118722 [Scleropages formosus]|uniref:Uncharacterized protein n=1 Tax=Scleropages formosus TaxID=113540 RepID=A0A0P7UTZ4_SCLFO|nr:hypothetical protein Z043_118722 [Scleropages formosus]
MNPFLTSAYPKPCNPREFRETMDPRDPPERGDLRGRRDRMESQDPKDPMALQGKTDFPGIQASGGSP